MREANEKQAGDRSVIEFFIIAVILIMLVLAGVNSQSLMSGVNCHRPYVGLLCAALAEK